MLADTPGRAADSLILSAKALWEIGQANLFCRVMLGRQLIVIQDQQLRPQLEIPDPERPEITLYPITCWLEIQRRTP